MAVTIVTQPVDFGRVYDTNRLMHKFSSGNYSQPNFRFYIIVSIRDIGTSTYTQIAVVRKRPLSDGTCYFNPAELYSNYINYDLEIDIDELKEALNSNRKFKLTVFDEYGDPPIVQGTGFVNTDDLMLYNGLQEYIPYDIEAYGGGNSQWVMSGVTITQASWQKCGEWLVETGTHSTGEIKFNYSVGGGITGITSIEISYYDDTGDAHNVSQCLNSISTDEYVRFGNVSNVNEYFIITYGDKTDEETKTTWTNITYYEKGSAMDLGGFVDDDVIELEYTEFDETPGQGKFLTDALDFRISDDDYANLYYIADVQDRPATVRVKVWYWSDGMNVGAIGYNDFNYYTTDSSILYKTTNYAESAPNPIVRTSSPPNPVTGETGVSGRPATPTFKYFISTYNTGYTLDYTTDDNEMYYIPAGPKELEGMGVFDKANSKGGWVAYRIDLTDELKNPSKIYNKYPVYFYRKAKCDKYDPIQLFWLNPHGGFDNYTFYKKNYIEYDITQTRWQHRFSDTYTLGERGATVYKTQVNKKIVLNTDYLSGSEAQILAQLQMSPEIYATYDYQNTIYKIPYIIEDTKFQYKELKNEKMVTYEVTIVPAWNRVSQTS